MATINLLPWRDEYRQEKTREFFSVLVLLVILTSLVGYVWHAFIQSEIKNQKLRNSLYQKEISVLNKQVKEIDELKKQRKDLESKMEVIQNLQNKRPLIVHYFDSLVRSVPDGIYLSKLSREQDDRQDEFSVVGSSESNNRVSTFMRNLDRSEYFQSPNLKSVVKEDFELTFTSSSPSGK